MWSEIVKQCITKWDTWVYHSISQYMSEPLTTFFKWVTEFR